MLAMIKRKKITLQKAFPYILTVGSALGLLASFILSYDTVKISQNSHYAPACNLNPVLSCGDVINASGDKILNVPYPFYGIAAFAALLAIAVVLLAGAQFKRWLWICLEIGGVLGLAAAYAMLIKSVYKIHALCPYCLTIDIETTTMVWYLTLYNIDNKYMTLPGTRAKQTYKWVREHHLDLLILWFLIIIGLVLKHFWYYYGKHL